MRAGLVFILVVLLFIGGFWVYLLRFRLPVPTGKYPVGTMILNMTDGRRSDGPRALVVQLWYPAAQAGGERARYQRWQETEPAKRYLSLIRTDAFLNAPVAAAGTPLPVLLFGHRWGGERTQNTALAEDLASHGFVVAAIDHPGNSSRVLLADGRVAQGSEEMDGPDPASAEARIAWWNRTLAVWGADEEFVLDQLATLDQDTASPLHGRLDTEHAGAFGHSFGGAAALWMCGRDPRIRAAVNLDGYTFGGLDRRTAAQPILILYEQATGLSRAAGGSGQGMDDQLDRADAADVAASVQKFGGTVLYLRGMQHLDFSDQPLLPPLHRPGATGPIQPDRANALVRAAVLGFFNHALRGGAEPDFPRKTIPEQMTVPSR